MHRSWLATAEWQSPRQIKGSFWEIVPLTVFLDPINIEDNIKPGNEKILIENKLSNQNKTKRGKVCLENKFVTRVYFKCGWLDYFSCNLCAELALKAKPVENREFSGHQPWLFKRKQTYCARKLCATEFQNNNLHGAVRTIWIIIFRCSRRLRNKYNKIRRVR